MDGRHSSNLDAWDMVAKCSNEVLNLMTRLRDKESENSELKTRIQEIEAKLLSTEAKLEESRVSASKKLEETEEELRKTKSQLEEIQARQKDPTNSTGPNSVKRARAPSIEFVEIRKPKEVQPIHKTEHENVETADTMRDASASSKPVTTTQSGKSSPPSKKRRITPLRSETPSVNQAPERQVDTVSREEAIARTTSLSPRPSSRNSVQSSLSPVPSEYFSDDTDRQSVPLPNPSTTAARNPDQTSTSSSAKPVLKNEKKPKKEEVKEEHSKNLLGASSVPTVASSTPMPPSTSSTLAKPSPTETKKRKLKIPKVEEKWFLPDAEIKKYRDMCKPFPIVDPAPSNLEVSRKFLRETYGGSDMMFIQKFKINPSGARKRKAIFPRLDLNPYLARKPGEPGLIFSSRYEILENPPWTVFVRPRNVNPVVWLYLGEYKCTLRAKMTTEQFRAQSQHVQTKWEKHFIGKDAKGINIISLECVEYDHAFANDMKVRMATYDPAASKEKRNKPSQHETKPSGIKLKVPLSPSIRRDGPGHSLEDRPREVLSSASTSAPSGSSPTAGAEGPRRSNRPRSMGWRLQDMYANSDDEYDGYQDDDDSQSLYDELED